ncbi:MAG: class I SAM-dependent methyltransferase [Pseudomonadota bacterium]
MLRADPFDVLDSPAAATVLRRLHKLANRQTPALLFHYLPKLLRLWTGRKMDFSEGDIKGYYADKYIALEPGQAAFCHVLARMINARTVVEFGTSFGVSTIWLAAAIRANGGGRIISAELVPGKAEAARANAAKAGLDDLIEVRVGDARETLRDLPENVDLFLNDGFPTFALDILRLVQPRLRDGAVVITDNVGTLPADFSAYLGYIRDPANGFSSTLVPFKSGTEVSTWRRQVN